MWEGVHRSVYVYVSGKIYSLGVAELFQFLLGRIWVVGVGWTCSRSARRSTSEVMKWVVGCSVRVCSGALV